MSVAFASGARCEQARGGIVAQATDAPNPLTDLPDRAIRPILRLALGE
jgi:hypothetical protein